MDTFNKAGKRQEQITLLEEKQMDTFNNDLNFSREDMALLPLWLRRLPLKSLKLARESFKVVTKPGVDPICEAMGQANWLATGALSIVLLLSMTLVSFLFHQASAFLLPELLFTLLFSAPLYVLLGIVVLYGLARLLGGRGTFLITLYTNLLFQVPLMLLVVLLSTIPIEGVTWINTALALVFSAIQLYCAVLQVFALRAVHQLSQGRAVACVLLLTALSLPLFFFLGILIL